MKINIVCKYAKYLEVKLGALALNLLLIHIVLNNYFFIVGTVSFLSFSKLFLVILNAIVFMKSTSL